MLQFRRSKKISHCSYAVNNKVTYNVCRNNVHEQYIVQRYEAGSPIYDSHLHSGKKFDYQDAIEFAQLLADGGYDWMADIERYRQKVEEDRATSERMAEKKKILFAAKLLSKGISVKEFFELQDEFEVMPSNVIELLRRCANTTTEYGNGRGLRERFMALRPHVAATAEECAIVMNYIEGHGYGLFADLSSNVLYLMDLERANAAGNIMAPAIIYSLQYAVEFAIDMNEELSGSEADDEKRAILDREGDLLRGLLSRMTSTPETEE